MDRRESLKTLLIGTVAGGIAGASGIAGCKPGEEGAKKTVSAPLYGRTPEEQALDAKLHAETFFNPHEMATIAILCDIILPATGTAGSATQAGVPDFIEFMVKDLPQLQLPLRGGLMWLDGESDSRYEKPFENCTSTERMAIIDDIAFPDKADPAMEHGVAFFNRMRDLTMTGYYTSKMGIEDLGYDGNYANVWDGVPDEVLKKHGLSYDQEWLDKCIDQSKRNDIAEWDEEGNLLT